MRPPSFLYKDYAYYCIKLLLALMKWTAKFTKCWHSKNRWTWKKSAKRIIFIIYYWLYYFSITENVTYYFLFNVFHRANVGLFCSTPAIPLIRNVPRKNAMYMLFTGLPISGKEAYEYGLVSKVVANDKLGKSSKNEKD